jgi:hypothetical protein
MKKLTVIISVLMAVLLLTAVLSLAEHLDGRGRVVSNAEQLVTPIETREALNAIAKDVMRALDDSTLESLQLQSLVVNGHTLKFGMIQVSQGVAHMTAADKQGRFLVLTVDAAHTNTKMDSDVWAICSNPNGFNVEYPFLGNLTIRYQQR